MFLNGIQVTLEKFASRVFTTSAWTASGSSLSCLPIRRAFLKARNPFLIYPVLPAPSAAQGWARAPRGCGKDCSVDRFKGPDVRRVLQSSWSETGVHALSSTCRNLIPTHPNTHKGKYQKRGTFSDSDRKLHSSLPGMQLAVGRIVCPSFQTGTCTSMHQAKVDTRIILVGIQTSGLTTPPF